MPTPVLVMSHNDGTLVGGQYIGVIMQIVLADHIEINVLLLGPADEISFISRPSISSVVLCKTLRKCELYIRVSWD